MRRIVVGLFFSVVLLVVQVGGVTAIEYGGLGGRPAYPRQGEPRSESIFIHTVTAGQLVNEGVYVINNSDEIKTLLVYATDSTPSTDGGYACKQLLEDQIWVGTWINLDESEVIVRPKTKELVNFTIKVPESIEVGEHNGCIIIQEKKEKATGPGINLSLRTGIRVALTVPGEIIRQLVISDFQVSRKDVKTFVMVPELTNQGNVSLNAEVKVSVNNITGKNIRDYGGEYQILREDTARWNFEFVRPWWGGIYTAELGVKYNDGNQDINLTAKPIRFIAWPDWRFVVIALAASIPLLVLLVYRSLWIIGIRRAKRNWVSYTIKEGDTLPRIADRFEVGWKKLAAVNSLRPPYGVKTGQKIKVPDKD